jgi:phospholipase/lecithinase/hemolysin
MSLKFSSKPSGQSSGKSSGKNSGRRRRLSSSPLFSSLVSSKGSLALASTVVPATAIALFIILQSSLPVKASDFSHIYAFGDSLVDTGNAFAETGIPPEPYYEGHFSNGPIWIDYLASDLRIANTNFAYGGARSDDSGELQIGSYPAIGVPGMLTQVNAFVASSPSVDEKALYVIWVGANDYLSGEQTQPLETVGNISEAVSTLSAAGAKNFLIANLPDLGELPLVRVRGAQPEISEALNVLSVEHNRALAETLSQLKLSDNVTINLLDAYSLFESAEKGELGISEITDACTLVPECVSNPSVQSSYLFWDEVHPTTVTHRIIANSALALVEQ